MNTSIITVSTQELVAGNNAFNFYDTVMHNEDLGFDDLPEFIRQFATSAHHGLFCAHNVENFNLLLAFLNTIYASADHKTVFVEPFMYTLEQRKNMVEAFSAIVKLHGGTVHNWPTKYSD